MSLAIVVIGCLAIFVSLFPLGLGRKFDPLNPPSLLEPEWYFMGFYQFLKTENVEPFWGVILMAALGTFVVLTPFLDRSPERRPMRRPVFAAAALIIIVEFVALTVYGYLTPGHVASFSEIGFAGVFIGTNAIAVGLAFFVFLVGRRGRRGPR
jgi:quinol-cytochrome oxidoreductase complex cytochrome b subunit